MAAPVSREAPAPREAPALWRRSPDKGDNFSDPAIFLNQMQLNTNVRPYPFFLVLLPGSLILVRHLLLIALLWVVLSPVLVPASASGGSPGPTRNVNCSVREFFGLSMSHWARDEIRFVYLPLAVGLVFPLIGLLPWGLVMRNIFVVGGIRCLAPALQPLVSTWAGETVLNLSGALLAAHAVVYEYREGDIVRNFQEGVVDEGLEATEHGTQRPINRGSAVDRRRRVFLPCLLASQLGACAVVCLISAFQPGYDVRFGYGDTRLALLFAYLVFESGPEVLKFCKRKLLLDAIFPLLDGCRGPRRGRGSRHGNKSDDERVRESSSDAALQIAVAAVDLLLIIALTALLRHVYRRRLACAAKNGLTTETLRIREWPLGLDFLFAGKEMEAETAFDLYVAVVFSVICGFGPAFFWFKHGRHKFAVRGPWDVPVDTEQTSRSSRLH